LKGSSLKNTEYIYGAAIYTGHETKIMKNSVGSRMKKSDVQKKMEKYILITILLQFSICALAGILSATWVNLTGQYQVYLMGNVTEES
jgi:magnesium-transporting ATPase (P-type)